jgi:hypothetical protein
MRGAPRIAAAASFAFLLSRAATSQALVRYEAGGGWFFSGDDQGGLLQQVFTPPAVEMSGGDFSIHGASCPPLGTPNFLCARFLSKAEIVGDRLTLRSQARFTRHDATGIGGSQLAYGDTRIWVLQMGSVAAPLTGYAYFNFGLAGVASATASNASVVVHGTGVATLYAPGLMAIQCTGYPCPPIVVPMNENPNDNQAWHPSTGIFVSLRADANAAAPLGVDGWDAEGVADFADTLELISIEIKDADHQPVPGAYIYIPNADGNGLTLPISNEPPPSTTTTTTLGTTTTTTLASTTTTTLPGTTTTTSPGVSSTTTTVSPATTTTTTLPGAVEACGNCADDDANGLVDFEEAACCPASGVRTLSVRKARFTSQGGTALVALDATVGGTALADVVPARDLFLQLRVDGGPALFCARIPAERFVVKRGKLAVFADRGQSVGDAGGITGVTLRASKGNLLVHIESRRAHFVLPSPGTLRLVLAFRDPGGAHRCARTPQKFRRAGKKALRAP